jgi:cytoskeleton protein RodZ
MDMSTGDLLRNARRSRGMTIEQISRVTKISAPILRALEADDHARLPGWVFTRGFLRSYAREVGLDPQETVATFLEQNAPVAAPVLQGTRTAPDISLVPEPDPIELEPSTDIGQMIAIAVIVIAAVAYLGLHNRSRSAVAPTATVATAPPHQDTTTVPIATSGGAAPEPIAAESSELKIDLVATGECWISAAVDEQPPIRRLMQAGERVTVTPHVNLTLRVGDPGTFQLMVNGVAGKPLGQPATPVTIRITPQNARDYLAR